MERQMNRAGLNSAEIRFQNFQIFRGKLISMLNHRSLIIPKNTVIQNGNGILLVPNNQQFKR